MSEVQLNAAPCMLCGHPYVATEAERINEPMRVLRADLAEANRKLGLNRGTIELLGKQVAAEQRAQADTQRQLAETRAALDEANVVYLGASLHRDQLVSTVEAVRAIADDWGPGARYDTAADAINAVTVLLAEPPQPKNDRCLEDPEPCSCEESMALRARIDQALAHLGHREAPLNNVHLRRAVEVLRG